MLKTKLKHLFTGLFSSIVIFWPQIVYASDPPILTSPPDSSSVDKSPKLTWEYIGECVQSGSCFRVEIDNNPDFSSPEKSTYTNNFSYSPQNLNGDSWQWRVKAKDKSENWSEWSKIFTFTISNQSASVSPSPAAQILQPSPTPQTSSKPQTNFTVKDIPSEINSSQEFEILISLTIPNNPNQTFYLKGAFKMGGSSNYFGETLNGSWVGNSEKYSSQYKISTDSRGSWEGRIKVRPDSDDSGFDGTGDYIFKVGRYSESGSGPSWSNELNLKINSVETPKPSPTPEPTKEFIEEDEPKEINLTGSLVKAMPADYVIKIASVAGEATISNNISPEEKTRVLEEKKINWFLIFLGGGILSAGSGYIYYKFRKEKINAKNLY